MRGRLALLALLAPVAPSIAIAQPAPAPDEPYPDEPYPTPAQPYPAQPYPAQPYPYPAQPYPAQPYPAQPYPAQPYPAQPYPAQPDPAQPYPAPAQPYPALAQPYPAQPYSVPAQPRQVAPPPYQVADNTWYGWKIALSDGAAYAAFFLADSIEDPGTEENDGVDIGPALLALGALGWWTFGTPLVHLTEFNFRGAGMSLALRWTAPLIGALVGSVFDPEASPDDPGATAGLVAGVAIASIVDITVISNRRTVRTVWPQPQLAVTAAGVRVGLAGAF